MESKWFEQKWK